MAHKCAYTLPEFQKQKLVGQLKGMLFFGSSITTTGTWIGLCSGFISLKVTGIIHVHQVLCDDAMKNYNFAC
jgi:hypothetical protein